VFPVESGARSSVCVQIQLLFFVFLSEFFFLCLSWVVRSEPLLSVAVSRALISLASVQVLPVLDFIAALSLFHGEILVGR
jgi:hypothetical protein